LPPFHIFSSFDMNYFGILNDFPESKLHFWFQLNK